MRRSVAGVLGLVLALVAPAGTARADWPMAGHDPQRTSWAVQDQMPPADKIAWMRKIEPYIPTKAHIITVAGQSGRPDMILVPTSAGVWAMNPDDGSDLWVYRTEMPVGHSPTFADGVIYVACTDGRIHAVDPAGKPLWRTARAGAGFDVSPLVVEGKVLAGSRDGCFYAFDARDGKYLWHYRTGGPISYSAAYADGVVYFAGYDCHAYALKTSNGELVWKSPKLPGEGFYSFWPVVAGDKVLFAGSNYYHLVGGMPMSKLEKLTRVEAWPKGVKEGDLAGPQDAQGWMDATQFVDYLTRHPSRQTLHVLDRATGTPAEVAPILWWGNPSGNRYPPALGPDGVAYISCPWMYHPGFCKGRVAGWKIGTSKLFPLPSPRGGLDSNDEPNAYAVIGNDTLYYNHKNDSFAAVYGLGGGTRASLPSLKELENFLPDYYSRLRSVNYGDPIYKGSSAGTHGNVTPPTPLKGKVYFHRSNAVVCLSPTGPDRAGQAAQNRRNAQ